MYKKLIFIELNEINFDLIKIYSLRHNFKVFNSCFIGAKLKNSGIDKRNTKSNILGLNLSMSEIINTGLS